jgi:hypothetical protein
MSIEAMKQALEALENWLEFDPENFGATDNRAVTALHQAIEQAEKQEPVAVVTGTYAGRFIVEPLNRAMVLPTNMALYTTPQPQREWVGLTEEEIQAILDNPEPFYDTMFWFARTIERKLKEKNT